MQFGSHVYGTNLPTSDLDFKGVYLPSPRDILLQKVIPSINTNTKIDQTAKNSADDIDMEFYSLQKYLDLLAQGQTVAISMLFTPPQWYKRSTWAWEYIRQNKHKFLHKRIDSYVGYCRTQANKYGIKGSRMHAVRQVLELLQSASDKYGHLTKLREIWPSIEQFNADPTIDHIEIISEMARNSNHIEVRMLSVCDRKVQESITLKEAINIYSKVFENYGHRALLAESNNGIDWKALMHACRVCDEAIELLQTGHVTYPLKNAKFLLDVRQGKLEYKQVQDYIEQGFEQLEIEQAKSTLPESADMEWIEDFLYETYYHEINANG